jgi:hypothetical protein
MRYLPKSPSERQEMLSAIGVRSAEELFASIPPQFRLKELLELPGPLSEAEIIKFFTERAAENSVGYTSFLGAGVYNHLRSVVTDAIIQRGEFLTSYTPYQAEIGHQHRFRQRVDVRRFDGVDGSGADGRPDYWKAAGGDVPRGASRISASAGDVREEFGY